MRFRPAGKVRHDAAASGGRLAELSRLARATKAVMTGPVARIVVIARGDQCPRTRGTPRMVLRVDGRRALVVAVRSATWSAYAVDRALPPGRHRFRISFPNPRLGRRCERSLAVDKISLVTRAPTPNAAAVPGPAPLPAAPAALWVSDFESSGFSRWDVQVARADAISIVASPVRQGRLAARFEVRDGDDKGGERAELARLSQKERPGTEYFYGWSTYFAHDFPAVEGWQNFLQWKGEGSGPPPLTMDVDNDVLKMQAGPQLSDRSPIWRTRLERGRWLDFVAHVKWSPDPQVGFAELWYGGSKVLPRRYFATMYRGEENYVKLGIYRSRSIRGPSVLYHDALRIGTSYEAVAPRS